MRFTLGKEEKLKSKTIIEQLFAEGSRVKSFPLQLIYLEKEHDSQFPIKVGFTVPKRAVKLAVNRNRIKRLLREVYRKNKHLFAKNLNKQYVFMFIYMGNKELSLNDLEQSIIKLCDTFLFKITENEQN
ncbi:MAG: ribonuclease P protein component [Lutibacter sp.]|uniref:ribonuclease P protein component n=1 Tax=Lutibacter sp. TaxID=1925666 RepID=UPI00385C75BA